LLVPRGQPWVEIKREISVRSCASLKQTPVYESVQPLAGNAFVSTNAPANVDEYWIFWPVLSPHWVSLK
jgi:hypothetical protein